MDSAEKRRQEMTAELAREPHLWWGHHTRHGWVVLDRQDARNSGESRHLLRCRDWSALEVSRAEFGSGRFTSFKNYLAGLPETRAREACGQLLALRRELAARPRSVIIRISGRARVVGRGGAAVDQATIRRLDGAVSDSECADYLDCELADLGITGGAVKLTYDARARQFRVVTEYKAPNRLAKTDLDLLTRQTQAQWSDGIGEGCFDRLCERLGVGIDLSPFCEEKDLRVEQFTSGQPGPRVMLGLHRAAREGNLVQVRSLLDAGADVNACQQGSPVLHHALSAGRAEVALELIARGADIHGLDVGQDALMICALSNRLGDADAARVARVLLERGADVHRPRGRPGSPAVLSLARHREKQQLAEVLQEFGAKE
jgi:hypothetical protein